MVNVICADIKLQGGESNITEEFNSGLLLASTMDSTVASVMPYVVTSANSKSIHTHTSGYWVATATKNNLSIYQTIFNTKSKSISLILFLAINYFKFYY